MVLRGVGARRWLDADARKRRCVHIVLVGFEPFRLRMAVNLAASLCKQLVVESQHERVLRAG